LEIEQTPEGALFSVVRTCRVARASNDYQSIPDPEDCQTWSYLALLKNKYRDTIDWALQNLEATDTASAPHSSLTGTERIHGLVFDSASLKPTTPNADPQAVWLEGTGHMIAALVARVLRGKDNVFSLFSDLEAACCSSPCWLRRSWAWARRWAASPSRRTTA